MKNWLLLLPFVVGFQLFAQDTTWVQTFTYDSISTRRATFEFPPELNDMRFEKVLMYYNLKCDPQTPWDSYNCGEWDYLAYTRVFDHTGDYDSVQVDSVKYMNDFLSSGTFNYDVWGYTYKDTREVIEHNRALSTLSHFYPNGSASSAYYPFDQNNKGGRYQMLMTASELQSAGMIAGDINDINLSVAALTGNGMLMHPKIKIKGTTDNSITGFHETGFTEVYDLSRDGTNNAYLLVGSSNDFNFYQPYSWNGTDNLIIEFSFDNGVQSSSVATFNVENSVPGMAVNYSGKNGVMEFDGNNYAMLELSDVDLGNEITIAFWAKGLGNTGVNTSILEAEDTLNDRAINIHMPWSNNNLYWDCGDGNGYDRIYQDMSSAGIDNEWHHWAFVKNQTTGEMKILRDGVLWHSGSGLTRTVGYMHRMILGANKDLANRWTGMIDEFQIFNVALDDATISSWYGQHIDPSHPNWNNLLVYYTFDNEDWAVDESQNDYLLMPSEKNMIKFSQYPVAGVKQDVNRPVVSFGMGTLPPTSYDVTIIREELIEPDVVFEFAPVANHFEIVNAFLGVEEGVETAYDALGNVISTNPFTTSNTISNESITYYEQPYEVIHDVEIGRFITPYGIGFDLGPNGFTWIYDVTDYQMYLKDAVDLAAHNTQELIDLKFAFIEGIPPRDVHNRQPIWSEWKSYNYGNLDNDVSLPAVQIPLSDTSSMFKIKTRITGHGHQPDPNTYPGVQHCCEWDNKDHMISIDGVERFNWEIWEETACGDNPNPGQGGTWPYAREGWCPGDMVKEYDHDVTPYVTPGTLVEIDYDIEDVPTGFPIELQANGNFVMAMDLISYSAPNHQYDMAIHDVLNPNDYEYYRKWNPSCQNPRVIIQNRGEQTVTECMIRVYISASNAFEYTWTGSLDFLEKEIVEIPVPNLDWWYNLSPQLSFTARIMSVNGDSNLDEYSQNDAQTIPFTAPDFIDGPFLVWFATNNKPWENVWRLEDESGNIIHQSSALAASTTYKDTFDLDPGCYSVIIEDNDSDGLGYWYSNQVEGETNGVFRLKKVGGSYIEFFPNDFGNYHRYNFSVGYQVGLIEDEVKHEIMMFPNPAEHNITIELSGIVEGKAELIIYDLMGKIIFKENMNAADFYAESIVDLTSFNNGQYIVKIHTGDRVYTDKFIKK